MCALYANAETIIIIRVLFFLAYSNSRVLLACSKYTILFKDGFILIYYLEEHFAN